MKKLRDGMEPRLRAIMPVGNDVQVIVGPPASFPGFKWLDSEGRTQSNGSDNFFTVIKQKWTSHVRRWISGNSSSLPPDAIVRFVLILRPVFGITCVEASSGNTVGEGWIPDLDGTNALVRDTKATPALVCNYASLSRTSIFGFPAESLRDTVDTLVHEVGHTLGGKHTTTMYFFADPGCPIPDPYPGASMVAPDTVGQQAQIQTTWNTPGVSRYMGGHVGVRCWDFAPWRNSSVPPEPFMTDGKGGRIIPYRLKSSDDVNTKFSIMGYTKKPWASDYNWAVWFKFLRSDYNNQFRPGNETIAMQVVPDNGVACVSKTFQMNAMSVFNAGNTGAGGVYEAKYRFPARWDKANPSYPGSVGPQLTPDGLHTQDATVGIYRPDSAAGNITIIIQARPEDPEYRADMQPGLCRLRLDQPQIRVQEVALRNLKLFVGQTVNLDLVDGVGNLSDPGTQWTLTVPGGGSTDQTGASYSFTAPPLKNTRKDADTYNLKASNPLYGLCTDQIVISVRQVILTTTDGPSLDLSASKSLNLSTCLKVEGGYSTTNNIVWRSISGSSLGTLDPATGLFTAGPTAGVVQIEAGSAEDPRVPPVTFSITIKP